MAGPNALLFSSKGVSAKFVAGSRRKSSKKSNNKSCARAGFFSRDDDFENTKGEEQSSS